MQRHERYIHDKIDSITEELRKYEISLSHLEHRASAVTNQVDETNIQLDNIMGIVRDLKRTIAVERQHGKIYGKLRRYISSDEVKTGHDASAEVERDLRIVSSI